MFIGMVGNNLNQLHVCKSIEGGKESNCGHQIYFCVAVVITPCQVVVLNICRCTLYFKNSFLQAGILELDTLFPFLSTLDVW